MLTDGVVDILNEKEIDSFLKDLANYANRIIKKNASNIYNVSDHLTLYANRISKSYQLNNIKWDFHTDLMSNRNGGYSPKLNSIWINLPSIIKNDKIDEDRFSEIVYHELTHVKQVEKYKKFTGKNPTSKGIYGKKSYNDSPWEQMALSRGELEYIKKVLNKVDPKQVINWVKKSGLISRTDLIQLKRTNYNAYKRILKYIVLFMMKKMNDGQITT